MDSTSCLGGHISVKDCEGSVTLPNLQVDETRPLATVSSIPVEDMKAPGSETKDGVFLRARELGRVSAFCVTASSPSSHRQRVGQVMPMCAVGCITGRNWALGDGDLL